jgi:nuclear transport factor 2 (NTF2) superfamily protein
VGGVTLRGSAAIGRFLAAKFDAQRHWHTASSLFVAEGARVAAHALSEWRTPDSDSDWWRTRCNDLYEFDDAGRILHMDTACNDAPIAEGERALRERAARFEEAAGKHGLMQPEGAAAAAEEAGAGGSGGAAA